MNRIPLVVTLCAAFVLPAAGCSKKDKGSTENPDATAESDVDPLEELKGIPDQIQAEVDMVLQPINDIDVVIDQIAAMPGELGVDATALTSMAKASFDGGGSVEVNLDVSAEAKAQIEAVLKTVAGIAIGLKELPERAKTATGNIVKLGGKATGLVTRLTAQYQTKLASPFTKAEDKAKIQAELDMVVKLDGDIKAVIGDAKQTVMGIPKKGPEALAKITAAFAGGASAGGSDEAEPADG